MLEEVEEEEEEEKKKKMKKKNKKKGFFLRSKQLRSSRNFITMLTRARHFSLTSA
jgi:predicted ribosome quality control (RQC) complex YloA/Tae2 family protein